MQDQFANNYAANITLYLCIKLCLNLILEAYLLNSGDFFFTFCFCMWKFWTAILILFELNAEIPFRIKFYVFQLARYSRFLDLLPALVYPFVYLRKCSPLFDICDSSSRQESRKFWCPTNRLGVSMNICNYFATVCGSVTHTHSIAPWGVIESCALPYLLYFYVIVHGK